MGRASDLIALRHARTLALLCRKAARQFPADERALADQLRRAADSAVLNIAEGNARGTNREFRQFLQTSRASLKEVEIIIELAADAGYIAEPLLTALRSACDEALRTLWGLLRVINERVQRGELERRRSRVEADGSSPP